MCLPRYCSHKVPGQTKLVCYFSSSHRRHGLELCLRPEPCFPSRLSKCNLGPLAEPADPGASASGQSRDQTIFQAVPSRRRKMPSSSPSPLCTRARADAALALETGHYHPPSVFQAADATANPYPRCRAEREGHTQSMIHAASGRLPDGASSWLAFKTSPVFQRPPTSSLAIMFNPTQAPRAPGAASGFAQVSRAPGLHIASRWREHMLNAIIPNIPPVSPGDVICIYL